MSELIERELWEGIDQAFFDAKLLDRQDDAIQLNQDLDDKYDTQWRETLAEEAAAAAVKYVPEAYRHQAYLKNAAKDAARIALGLKTLPYDEGEQ